MLRLPIRLAALTVVADAAAISLTRGDVQWILGGLGMLALLVWSAGRRVQAVLDTVRDTKAAFEKHAAEDAANFAALSNEQKATREDVREALQTMIELGTGRRRLERDAED